MGLVTKPPDFVAGVLTVAALNTLRDTIYDAFGTTLNGGGSISDLNIDPAAAIQRTKIADTAVVTNNSVNAGTQTIVRPTSISGTAGGWSMTAGAGWCPDFQAANIQTAAIVGAAQAVALSGGKGVLKMTSGAAASVSTITGGVQGQLLTIILGDANTTVNHTATNTANTIHFNRKAAIVGDAGMVITQLVFDGLITGTGQWWEI